MRMRGFPAVLGAVLALSACGGAGSAVSSSAVPAGSPTAATTPAKITSTRTCGDLQMKGNTYKAVILEGHPACPAVIKTFHAFFAAAKSGGKATVNGWKCGYKSPAVMIKTRVVAECTTKTEAIAARK